MCKKSAGDIIYPNLAGFRICQKNYSFFEVTKKYESKSKIFGVSMFVGSLIILLRV